ncbi:hypothetical protein GCM10022297_06110 [Lactobacillus hamsteri]|uniref:Uncharacterized protein n=1 Tax=Lactobacillus hamsteri DSM 5661 = JCM 6256 TaxID=1423754 RepID=A0A0R1Y5W6_9LACO|nr:phage holin [Lactobacillus hamsteri]KRM37808.1 hypothetical protein FC39_GL001722 [Lactobacillus hamsteri DSM 5661 = JCM 6256]
MTIKDWIYIAIACLSYLVGIVAVIYARDKGKINKATRIGQVLDWLGKIATNAVHEAEFLGGTGSEKHEFAADSQWVPAKFAKMV